MNSLSPIFWLENPAASSRSTSISRSVNCWRGPVRPLSDRTTAAALRESKALSPAEMARIARTSSVVSTARQPCTTYPTRQAVDGLLTCRPFQPAQVAHDPYPGTELRVGGQVAAAEAPGVPGLRCQPDRLARPAGDLFESAEGQIVAAGA